MREKDEYELRREARRKALKKKRIKKFFIFLLVVCIAVLAVLCFTVFFPIKQVKASGSDIYNEKQVIKAANLSGKNLLALSEEKTEDNVRKSLPLIDSIKLNKKLPDTVSLKVKDATEYSLYISNGKFYSASEKGYIMNEYPAEPQGLLKIVCTECKCKPGEKVKIKSEKESETIEKIIETLNKKNIIINAVDVSNPVAITVVVDSRFTVNLGTSAYLDKKIGHLGGMVASIAEGRKGNIDLSMWSPEKSEGSFTEIK